MPFPLPLAGAARSRRRSPPRSTSSITIVVQYNRASEALPIAHTCFYKLDLPDYPDQDMFVSKLMKAIQECATFDRV